MFGAPASLFAIVLMITSWSSDGKPTTIIKPEPTLAACYKDLFAFVVIVRGHPEYEIIAIDPSCELRFGGRQYPI